MAGGQAGTSSLIRNYLGFPRGLSGDDLTNRAFEQARLFGARVAFAEADGLAVRDSKRVVHTVGGARVEARAVVIATGVSWRRLDVPRLEALVGAGVFYGAAAAEARAMAGRDVYVIGAGNSAGQAALHLAGTRRRSRRGQPRTGWLAGCVERDSNGFILTGRDLYRTGSRPQSWPLQRPPSLLETSIPGVFAAGDVRHRSIKRVASAVGEGATAIQLVHEYLA